MHSNIWRLGAGLAMPVLSSEDRQRYLSRSLLPNRDRTVCLWWYGKTCMDINHVAQRPPAVPARERIVSTAYALFTRRGVRAVGIDEIISQSGVAKATMYRHFRTKNDLVLAVPARASAELR